VKWYQLFFLAQNSWMGFNSFYYLDAKEHQWPHRWVETAVNSAWMTGTAVTTWMGGTGLTWLGWTTWRRIVLLKKVIPYFILSYRTCRCASLSQKLFITSTIL
jgi:hypothetical protein